MTQNVLGSRYLAGGMKMFGFSRTVGIGDDALFRKGGGLGASAFTSGDRGRRPTNCGAPREGELLLLEASESAFPLNWLSLPPERDADKGGAIGVRLGGAYVWGSSSSSELELSPA